MAGVTVLSSAIDASRNFIIPYQGAALEARYVRRTSDKISAYVSSMNGCKLGCKMCHLTDMKMNSFNHTTPGMYAEQLKHILNYAETQPKAARLNVNFMARGEPFANRYVVKKFSDVCRGLITMADLHDLTTRINISTIMPHVIKNVDLSMVTAGHPVHLYYSLYSVEKKIRNYWLPNAIDYNIALQKLSNWQRDSISIPRPLTLHWCIIKGVNDNIPMHKEMRNIITDYQLNARLQIVRYNPPPNSNTTEANEETIDEIIETLRPAFKLGARKIPRVGEDVAASCGMFIKN